MVAILQSRMVETVDLAALERQPQAVVFAADPRTVRLSLAAGEGVPEHRHPGKSIVFHQLEGEITVHLDGEAHHLTPGELLRFDGERSIEPRAQTDSTSLIVLAPATDQT